MPRIKASRINDLEHAITGEKLSLLAIFARPEDEAFGPSGTLAKYAGEGIRVSLVTAARELTPAVRRKPDPQLALVGADKPRDTSCACRAAGIHRMCLDQAYNVFENLQEEIVEERIVRLIRELEPQVLVTYGPRGLSGDSEQVVISRAATRAFFSAGDATRFTQHLNEGLVPHQPRKLYYAVLPESLIQRWGLQGLQGVPDDQITTVLDVSPYSEMKLRAVYCQRNHAPDYASWLETDAQFEWNEEHFVLAASNLARKPRRERDLFAGLR